MKILVIGGVKSGKSRHAEKLCLEMSDNRHPVYLATTEIMDEEMRQRIDQHQKRRQDQFQTIEEPLAIASVVSQTDASVLIECLTMWLNNMLYHHRTDAAIFKEIETLMNLPHSMVLVLNEVGFGIIPDNALSRRFVDLSGRIAQCLGDRCDQIYLCVAGQKVAIKHLS